MGDLVCARIFVSKPLGIEFFPLTTKPWQVFPCKIFFTLEISLQDIYSEITHTPYQHGNFFVFSVQLRPELNDQI